METKKFIYTAFSAFLSACGPSEGAVFFVASRAGGQDTVAVDARTLKGANFDTFRGQDGTPIATDGDCKVFTGTKLGLVGQINAPGTPVQIGQLSLAGPSIAGDIDFSWDQEDQAYVPQKNGGELFVAGDKLLLQGENTDLIDDFSEEIEFPQDVLIAELPKVNPGSPATISWNPSNIKASEVSVIIVATDVFFQDTMSVVCRTSDDGSVQISGLLTGLLPSGGLSNSVTVARVNGDNLYLDVNGTLDELKRGKEVLMMTFTADTEIGLTVD